MCCAGPDAARTASYVPRIPNILSPHLAGPVSGRKFIKLLGVTAVTRTERFATLGVVLFDRHVGITKADDFFFALVTGFDDELLPAGGFSARFVTCHL